MKNIVKYSLERTVTLGLSLEQQNFLSQKGLPLINNDYMFFAPLKELEVVKIDNVDYVTLGHPLHNVNSNKDEVIILEPKTGSIYFYSLILYQTGHFNNYLVFVNKNIDSFVFFCEKINEVQNVIFSIKKDIKHVKLMLSNLIQSLINKDIKGIGFMENYKLYWRQSISQIIDNISEFYDENFLEFILYLDDGIVRE